MKKRVMAMLLALALCVTGVFYQGYEAKAEDMGEDMDYSYLLAENTLVGFIQSQTRGVYLVEGNSFINKQSSTKIGAGGTTSAAYRCKVSVTSIVERQVNGSWVHVTSWTSTNESGYSAMVSKSLTVSTGYYYRVRSLHYAASDASSSWTNALSM